MKLYIYLHLLNCFCLTPSEMLSSFHTHPIITIFYQKLSRMVQRLHCNFCLSLVDIFAGHGPTLCVLCTGLIPFHISYSPVHASLLVYQEFNAAVSLSDMHLYHMLVLFLKHIPLHFEHLNRGNTQVYGAILGGQSQKSK